MFGGHALVEFPRQIVDLRQLLRQIAARIGEVDQAAGISAKVTLGQTLMTTLEDREALARTVLGAARLLRRKR